MREGTRALTVVKPNTKITNSLPILDGEAGIDCHGMSGPYRRLFKYCRLTVLVGRMLQKERLMSTGNRTTPSKITISINRLSCLVCPKF